MTKVLSKRPIKLATLPESTGWVFCLLWVIGFILYFPAAKAGMVGDFPGWFDQVKNSSFREYLNWNIGGVTTLYQFTQIVTYILYKLFWARHWPWHLVQLSMHVANCTLLYQIFKQLLNTFDVKRAASIPLLIALLFCVSPYASEVVVYEPCFHFSMSLMMMLFILLWVQQYMETGRAIFIWRAGVTYFLSTYSLEFFYLTPLFTASLIVFYYKTGRLTSSILKKTLCFFLLPQVLFFGMQLIVYHMVYGNKPPHSIYLSKALWLSYLANPAKYLFHILFLGRYFPDDARQAVYKFLENGSFIAVFYAFFLALFIILFARFRKISAQGKITALTLLWAALTLLFVMPLWFYDTLLIIFDRYAYLPAAFTYCFIVILLSYIPNRYVVNTLLSAFVLVNVYFTVQTNKIWQQSAEITNTLLRTFPDVGNKTVLILNAPQCYKGALMIRAIGESEFKQMHNLLLPEKKIDNKVYDVASYNMLTPQDGAHIMVVGDNICHVTLNQFGNYWWYNDHGARGYETDEFKVNMADVGHWYELTLKHPASQYVLLYIVDDQWKVVDWDKRTDQY